MDWSSVTQALPPSLSKPVDVRNAAFPRDRAAIRKLSAAAWIERVRGKLHGARLGAQHLRRQGQHLRDCRTEIARHRLAFGICQAIAPAGLQLAEIAGQLICA